ncbi:hypothetical protein TNIN_463001 [Trichonephila inaurata madagascariensis]|uniref:Uncharacterized protein n=1 Tax=Trichonephila inaurata madagascariensis TaxID=2747483 RepID=A0A8X6Y4H6_9ARAC|nr:hypothetical protein TNIN_463001 [Trichonephila inaurata madagascariensis]
MDIGKTFIKEQLNNNRKKDSEKGVFNHRFDFNGLEVLHSGKLTEKTVMPSRFINAVGYIQEPRNRYSISEFNIPFSSKYSQKENSWIEISPQAYTSEPLMSTERIQRHKYLQHDEQQLQPVIDNDGAEFQNFLDNFKTYSEMYFGKTFIKEQLSINRRKDSKRGVFNHHFDFNGLEALHSGKFTEKTVMLYRFINAIGYIQEQRNRYSISEVNTNELSLLLKYSQKENSWIERSPQANASELLMSTESRPMEMYSHGMNEQFNRHQLHTSEYRQTQHFGTHEQINLNQSFRYSGIQQMI